MKTKWVRSATAALFCLATLQGCASSPDIQPLEDPEAQLREGLQEWQALRADGNSCASGGRRYPYVDCGRIQAKIERLVLDFPNHPSILLANAVISSQTGRPDKAIAYLDELIDAGNATPDAIVLRSQLAIQTGNLPFARRLLGTHTRLVPDHPGLREAMASVHYLDGSFAAARRDLAIAQRLGAPSWRIAYHRGLIEETTGNEAAAMREYGEALRERPDWAEPRSRLRGLESRQIATP